MGKTNPTHRDQIRKLQDHWDDYGRMLRFQNQSVFDQLWTYAGRHADAGGAVNPTDPMESVFMSICLEQQRRINELETRLKELEEVGE